MYFVSTLWMLVLAVIRAFKMLKLKDCSSFNFVMFIIIVVWSFFSGHTNYGYVNLNLLKTTLKSLRIVLYNCAEFEVG